MNGVSLRELDELSLASGRAIRLKRKPKLEGQVLWYYWGRRQ